MQFQVLTRDPMAERAIAAVLGLGDELPPEVSCPDLATLKSRLAMAPAQVVLADIDPNPLENLEALSTLINGSTQTRFVAICTGADQAVLLKAMQVGVRHLQLKQGIRAELGGVLRQFSAGMQQEMARRRGMSILVLQASGGAGATTLAVNLANELHLASNKQALLIDLDETFGAAACYLDVTGRFGVTEVLGHKSEIDGHLVMSTSVRFTDGVHVLLSPASTNTEQPQPLYAHDVGTLVLAAKEAYAYTVLDVPRAPLKALSSLATHCNVVLVVLQALVKDVRFAKALCTELMEFGIKREQIVPVVNRFARTAPVPIGEIETALRGFHVFRVANDFKTASRSFNHGKPLAEHAKRSYLRRDIIKLMETIAQPVAIQGN